MLIVRVTFNEYNRTARKSAEVVGRQIEEAFPDEKLLISHRPMPYAGSGEIIKAEVVINFPMTNADEARDLSERINALGIESRTYHDCD